MKRILVRIGIGIGVVLILLVAAGFVLAHKPVPSSVTYGITFSTMYAHELGLDSRKVYDAFLNDLGVRHLRLPAYWPLVEPKKGTYDFSELDYQLKRANEVGADVILAVGRRLPRWPECHVPDWASKESWDAEKNDILDYMTAVVNRYKDNAAIKYWQVENEPYLTVFATDHCGSLDEQFLKDEIQMVHELDPSRKVLVTDSGNLGTWMGAYQHGDLFGTSVYVYLWNPQLGPFKTILPPWFYRLKEGIMKLLYGTKQTMLIELSAEPWLLEPVTDAPLDLQFSRMNLDKFNEILQYAKQTRYDQQYLWGGEWWYWLKENGHPEMWERGKQLFHTGQ